MLHLPKQSCISCRVNEVASRGVVTKTATIIVIWKASRTEIESDRPLRSHRGSQPRLADRLDCREFLLLMRCKLFVQMTRAARRTVPAVADEQTGS